MNDIIKDYMKESFTLREWLVYGVIAPAALIIICLLAGAI